MEGVLVPGHWVGKHYCNRYHPSLSLDLILRLTLLTLGFTSFQAVLPTLTAFYHDSFIKFLKTKSLIPLLPLIIGAERQMFD